MQRQVLDVTWANALLEHLAFADDINLFFSPTLCDVKVLVDVWEKYLENIILVLMVVKEVYFFLRKAM